MGRGSAGLVVVLLVAVAAGFAPKAHADDPYFNEDEYTAFYTPAQIRCRRVSRAI